MTPETKLFEIRDRHTLIPAVGIMLSRDNGPLARHAGYGEHGCVLLTPLIGGKSHYDPYGWADRTMQTAHNWIVEKWGTLESGDVIDVEFILLETTKQKESDMHR